MLLVVVVNTAGFNHCIAVTENVMNGDHLKSIVEHSQPACLLFALPPHCVELQLCEGLVRNVPAGAGMLMGHAWRTITYTTTDHDFHRHLKSVIGAVDARLDGDALLRALVSCARGLYEICLLGQVCSWGTHGTSQRTPRPTMTFTDILKVLLRCWMRAGLPT